MRMCTEIRITSHMPEVWLVGKYTGEPLEQAIR